MNPLLVTGLTFVATIVVCLCIYSIVTDLFMPDESRVSRRIDEQLRQHQREQVKKSKLFKNLSKAQSLSDEPDQNLTTWQQLELIIEQSGTTITVQRFIMLTVISALGATIIVGVLWRGPVTTILAGLLAGVAPFAYIWRKRRLRLQKLLSQMPDAFDLMARVLRAGQTSTQALQAVSDEFSPPLSTEFQYCFEQQNLGLSAELSLRDLAKRTGLLEMKIFVLGMLVQQQTGGNIAELVEKLATVIRGRQRIQGKIAALTAEGRIQAAILLLLPPVMFCILLIASPGYPLILFKYPSVIVGIAISELIGAVWIRQIVDFNF